MMINIMLGNICMSLMSLIATGVIRTEVTLSAFRIHVYQKLGEVSILVNLQLYYLPFLER